MSEKRDVTALLLPVLIECRDAASLHVSRCKSESQFDLIPYYEGRRDAFAEIVRHIEEEETEDHDEWTQERWNYEWDQAIQWRDWQTCDQLIEERERCSWWPAEKERIEAIADPPGAGWQE